MERRWFSSALLSVGALGPCVGYAQPPEQAPDTMEARVQGLHGLPRHARGKVPTTTTSHASRASRPTTCTNQLQTSARDTGRRKYPPMNYLVTYLSDDYLHKIRHLLLAAQRPPLPTPANPDVINEALARGQFIVVLGDAAAGYPPVRAATVRVLRYGARNPRSSRFALEYISAQLGAWR